MPRYNYETQKPNIFTEDGQVMFLAIRDKAHELLKQAGVFRLENVISGIAGDTWNMLACVDRLVELREIRELTDPTKVAGQDRCFVKR